MVVVIVILSVVIVALAVQLLRCERELRAIAQFLVRRNAESNARVTISVHTRGFQRLGQAVNRQLDRHQGERIAAIEQASKVRKGLTYLSHDIRTPLAGAKGYAQLLTEETDPAMQVRYIGAIERRLNDSSRLLDQLFSYAQVQDPDFRVTRDPVDANAVLVDALVSFYAQLQEKGWEPAVALEDDKRVVVSDADALGRIFRNLVSNTLRYGIDAPVVEQRGRKISLSNRVVDPEAFDTTRLFDRFYQGDESRSGEGSGLGLAIVAQLARALDVDVFASLDADRLTVSLVFPEGAGSNLPRVHAPQ